MDKSKLKDESQSKTCMNISQAAEEGDLTTVKKLIVEGADINYVDKKRRSPLHYAASGCHSEVIALLINRGADVNGQTKKKMTPLMSVLASRNSVEQKIASIKVLNTERTNLIEPRDKYGRTHLHWAIKGGNLEIVRFILDHGGKGLLKTSDNFKKTCVFEASRYNKSEILEYLLTRTGDESMYKQIMILDRKLWLPFHYAASHGNVDVIKCFTDTVKADINQKMENGLTPLMAAASKCQIHVVRYLLQSNDIDINITDVFGSNALIHLIIDAFRYKRIPGKQKTNKPWANVAYILLQNNIDINRCTNYTIFWPSKNYHSQNALEIALKSGLEPILKLLCFAGSKLGNLEIYDIKSNEKYLKKNENLVEWVREFYSQPRSLRDMCRICIRNYTGNKFMYAMNNLSLAKSVKEYLLLKDLEYLVDTNVSDIHNTLVPDDSEYEYEPSIEDSD